MATKTEQVKAVETSFNAFAAANKKFVQAYKAYADEYESTDEAKKVIAQVDKEGKIPSSISQTSPFYKLAQARLESEKTKNALSSAIAVGGFQDLPKDIAARVQKYHETNKTDYIMSTDDFTVRAQPGAKPVTLTEWVADKTKIAAAADIAAENERKATAAKQKAADDKMEAARKTFEEAVKAETIAGTGATPEQRDAVYAARDELDATRKLAKPAEKDDVRARAIQDLKEKYVGEAEQTKTVLDAYEAARASFEKVVKAEARLGTKAKPADRDAVTTARDALNKAHEAMQPNEKPEVRAEAIEVLERKYLGEAEAGKGKPQVKAAPKAGKADRPGRKDIVVDQPAPAADDAKVFKIQKGNSLSGLAQDDPRLAEARKKVEEVLGNKASPLTVTLVLSMAMAEANGIKKPDHIQPGWKIDIEKTIAKVPEIAGKMKLTEVMREGGDKGADITGAEFRGLMKGKTTEEILAPLATPAGAPAANPMHGRP